MKAGKRFSLTILILILSVIFGATPGLATDKSFSSVVKHIKAHYGAKSQSTFGLISFARLAVKMVRPAGVKNFKVVMLKELDFSENSQTDFHKFVHDAVDPAWQPVIEIAQPRKTQWTYVYASEEGKHIKFLVVTLQQEQAFVVQFKFDPDRLSQFIDNPNIMGISLKDDKDHDQEDSPGEDEEKESDPNHPDSN